MKSATVLLALLLGAIGSQAQKLTTKELRDDCREFVRHPTGAYEATNYQTVVWIGVPESESFVTNPGSQRERRITTVNFQLARRSPANVYGVLKHWVW